LGGILDENDPKFESERKKLMQTPVNQIQVHRDMTVRELVENFSGMSIQARNIGSAAKIWEKMRYPAIRRSESAFFFQSSTSI